MGSRWDLFQQWGLCTTVTFLSVRPQLLQRLTGANWTCHLDSPKVVIGERFNSYFYLCEPSAICTTRRSCVLPSYPSPGPQDPGNHRSPVIYERTWILRNPIPICCLRSFCERDVPFWHRPGRHRTERRIHRSQRLQSPNGRPNAAYLLPGRSHSRNQALQRHSGMSYPTPPCRQKSQMLTRIAQPTHAYFGQKDIQQALILKRLVTDLLMSYPTPQNLHIVPTARDPTDGLALSSRNVYLSPAGRKVAPTLRQALLAAEAAWNAGATKYESLLKAVTVMDATIRKAHRERLAVEIKLDYIEMNDTKTFEVLDAQARKTEGGAVILSGALYVDKTRLIDNTLLGDTTGILG